jgi:methionine-rich copper-binding protein CopC
MNKGIGMAAALALLLAPASALLAHTALKSSSPKSGTVLTQSPPVLTLTFAQSTRLTSLKLVNTAGEKPLPFKPGGKALTFTTAKPVLVPGRNEIRWRALSQDGHVVDGSIILVLRKPKA